MKDYDKILAQKKKPTFKFDKGKDKRTIIKLQGQIPDNAESGLIKYIAGTSIIVETEQKKSFDCSTAGIIVSSNQNQSIVAVGDTVRFTTSGKNNQGVIVKVEERKNHFSRKEVLFPKEDVIASNIDNLLIIMSVMNPYYNKRLIDRFLVTAELNHIEPFIIINKIDLIEPNEILDDFEIYRKLNIGVDFISAKFEKGIESIKNVTKDKISVLTGPSGSGKSTLFNKLLGENYQTIRETSELTGKGKHTTSAVKMFDLPDGGYIIDTPGIREFGIWGMEKNELALYFHEFDEYNNLCKYYPCTHTHEPECAVINALEKGKIDFDRYQSYINMFDSLE